MESSGLNMMNEPMRISDAASLLRREIDFNERPLAKLMLLGNNAIVDEWHEKVLKKICNTKGQIKSGQFNVEWEYFYNGIILPNFIKGLESGLIVRPDTKIIECWKFILENEDMETLIKRGPPVIGHGWKLLMDEFYISKSLQRWELVYSHSDDPMVWRKLANNHPKLWNEDGNICFWPKTKYDEVAQKVQTILSVRIAPSF
jgi:hypothetical protein